MRTVYLNGEFIDEREAKLSVFDRAFLFGDAVYEVIAVVGTKFVDFTGHCARLCRSLDEMALTAPLSEEALLAALRELVSRNSLDQGIVYMQVTRGVGDRDFRIADQAGQPNMFMFTQAMPVVVNPLLDTGAKVVTAPDLRWGRRDIKSVQLLYPSLAYSHARRAGADDVWLVEGGTVTEAAAKNAHIVTKQGAIVTRHLSHAILPGVTRAVLLEMARENNMTVVERPFSVGEVKQAAEAFMTSCGQFVTPVVSIDGSPIGTGKVGILTRRLSQLYIEQALAKAI